MKWKKRNENKNLKIDFRYQLERKLFEELHELKRFQIRSGRSNEVLMVKRLVDKFRRDVKAPGMTDFTGPYTYKNYEFYLYGMLDQMLVFFLYLCLSLDQNLSTN